MNSEVDSRRYNDMNERIVGKHSGVARGLFLLVSSKM